MHITRRLVATTCGVLLAPLVPLALSAAPAAAATCSLPAPTILAADVDSVVLKTLECSSTTGFVGYRFFAFENGSTDVAASVDIPLGVGQGEITGLHVGSGYRFRVAAVKPEGASTRSIASVATVLPFTSVPAFATQQYLDFTGAAATPTQRAAWSSTVGANVPTKTPAEAVSELQQGTYWQVQSPVIRLFQAYFLRLPDPSGLGYWTAKSRAGTRLNAISSTFAGSNEFTTRYGKLSNKAFVNLVYQNVLGRPGDAGGVASWTAKLDQKLKSRGEVMVGFSESSEYQRKSGPLVDVVNTFTGMLRRVPTAAERDTWVSQDRLDLIDFLLGSEEYGDRTRTFPPPAIIPVGTMPNGAVGQPYGPVQMESTMGRAPITWSAYGAGLPAGLTISPSGVISGTPTKQTPFKEYGIIATGADGQKDQIAIEIGISGLALTPATLPAGQVGTPYSVALELSGATGAIQWEGDFSVPGLSFSSGSITGTPSQAGSYSFFLQGVDQAGKYWGGNLTLTVAGAPS